jgi:hypothetical protein
MLGPQPTKEERMKQSRLRRIGAVVVICAVVGALAGIAGSAAAPSKSNATQAKKKAKAQRQARRQGTAQFFGGGHMGPGGGALHSESVVPNAAGTGFDTITSDAGTLTSVAGNTVHIKEATDKATDKDDVAIDVGSNPTVIRNHAKATLADLKPDDHVRVIQGGPQGTIVVAEDAATLAQEQKDHEGRGHDRGAPPPGTPAAPGAYPGDGDSGSSSSGSPAGGGNS